MTKRKSKIERSLDKEQKTFGLMAKKIIDAIKDEKELRAFAKTSLEILYKDNPNLFSDHAKLKLKKK
jgi:hypothetical protein